MQQRPPSSTLFPYTTLFRSTEIALHPAYQQIIGMGKEAIPLILEELQREEDHWFWALKSITGDDPVAPSERGQLPKMTRSEEHTSELQSHSDLVCRLLLEKK